MERSSRATLVLMLITLVGLGAASIKFRAVAQQTTPPSREVPAEPAPESKDDGDSAQSIEDDPTVAPDEDTSADNNVTFPIDI